MGQTDHQKLQETVAHLIAESGGISVIFNCGCDGSGVSFSGWKDKGEHRWSSAKEHLRLELIKKLHLSNNSNHKVDGNGWIEIKSGCVELTYSLFEAKLCDLSDAEMLLPVPDAENLLIVSKDSIGSFDFQVTLAISAGQTQQFWHSGGQFETIPRVTGQAKKQLIELLGPVIQPHFEQITASRLSCHDGEIAVRDLDFKGYYWHSTGEMYYAITFGRERIVRTVKSEKIVLFDLAPLSR